MNRLFNPAGRLGAALVALAIAIPTTAGAANRRMTVITGSVAPGNKHVMVTAKKLGRSALVRPKTGLFVMHSPKLGGTHTLIFKSGHKTFAMSVDAPVGGKLVLKDVVLMASAGSGPGVAQADEEDLTVSGTLMVDCTTTPLPTVTLTNSAGSTSMTFDPTVTEIFDASTSMRISSCTDLSTDAGPVPGAPARAEGRLNPDGSLFALEIVVNPSPESDNGDINNAEFTGAIAAAPTCNSDGSGSMVVTQSGDSVNVNVNILTTTEINVDGSEDQSAGSCSSLSAGMQVKVEGQPNSAGSVNALQIEVQSSEFDSEGMITGAPNCSATPPSFSFTPDGSSTTVTVTIGPATEIEMNDSDTATCANLTTGAAEVEGVVQSDGNVAATKIEESTSP